MHVLIDARMYSPHFTGIGRYVYEITQEFFRQKPDWKFTLFLGEKEYKNFIPPSENIQIIYAPEQIYSAGEQTSFLKKLLHASKNNKKIYKNKYTNTPNTEITWFPHFNVPLFYPKNFVVTVHDLTLSKFPGKKHSLLKSIIYKIILKNALFRSQKILTVSDNTKSDLIQDENISPEKIIIAGNAVGNEFLNFIPDKNFHLESLRIYKKFFLYTGQWRSHKNVLGMVQAFHQFLEKNKNTKISAQLVMTGKPNDLYPEVLEYRKKHHLEEDIIPVGLVDESTLLHLYHHAEIFVFPSFYEGFGIPPLEAMAMQTPVIASHSSSIPEVCKEAALYFDPSNIKELANKMDTLINNKALQNTLVKKGSEQIKKFSWKKSAQKILEVLEKSAV